MKYLLTIISILAIVAFTGCNSDDSSNLPSVEERVSAAKADLLDELTSPLNGWEVRYSPTDESGIFYMLLNFSDDGTVRIQSDVPGDDGAYYDHVISYRIDNALHLELIFDTYGAFHYLFEQDQASFGAEFEFFFDEKNGDNLIFESKNDVSNPSIITFVPAQANASDLFSRELASNMDAFLGTNPRINFSETGSPKIRQQLYIENANVSVYWAIDISKRFIEADIAGIGSNLEEIEASGEKVAIGIATGFGYLNGAMVFEEAIEFNLGGQQYSIGEISLGQLDATGEIFCDLNPVNTAVYSGSIDGLGNVQLLKSLYASEGERLQPRSDFPYSINAFFIFDENINSLQEEGGSLLEKFPTATGFIFSYGFTSEDYSEYSLGFNFEDEEGNTKSYAREFEPTTTVGNRIEITLTDN
ncbi:MAG: DUF4302 domain-containing protein, partial [bacterium]|nr:DUF4302 domain-containing protein [bacterium]